VSFRHPWQTEVAAIEQALEEIAEEHSGEEGLLFAAKNEKGKITKGSVKARLSEAEGTIDFPEPGEIELLTKYVELADNESAASAKLKQAQDKLIEQVAAKYPKLTEDEIKMLVVDDKWLATIAAAVQGELDRVSQTLAGRIRQLIGAVFSFSAVARRRKLRKNDILVSTVRPNLRSHLLFTNGAPNWVCSTGFPVSQWPSARRRSIGR